MRRGFSLLELMLTIGLAVLLVGGSLMAMHRPMAQASSRAVAEQVAEFLRAARQQAIAEQVPVAVLLPTAGTRPCSQSLALARGESGPVFSRVLDFSKESPHTVLFVGTYPATSNWSLNGPDLGEAAFLQTGFAPGSEPLAQWVGSRSDFVFLFNPRGSICTNNLPHLNGSYRIVVSQGALTGAATTTGTGLSLSAPPPYAGLTAAADPYTILISASGAVAVQPGLSDYSGSGVDLDGSQLAVTAAPALPLTAPATTDPSIIDVQLYPPQGVEAVAQGVTATMNRDRELTLTVRATIDTPEDLFCNVTVTGVDDSGNPVADVGSLSSPGARRMRYNPGRPGPIAVPAHWSSDWQWLPPVGLPGSGTLFTFTATVQSRRSNLVTTLGTASLTKTVKIYDKGRIYFGGLDPYTNQLEIFMVRADGSDLTRITHEEPTTAQISPSATRDGNKLLFAAVDPAPPNTTVSNLTALSRLGGLSTNITDTIPAGRPSFSDDSTVAVFEHYDPDVSAIPQMWAFDPNGSWPPPRIKIYDNGPAPTMGIRSPCVSPPPTTALALPYPAIYGAADPRRACRMRRAAFSSDFNPADPASGAPLSSSAIYTAYFCLPPSSPAVNTTASIPLTEAHIRKISSPSGSERDETPCFAPDPDFLKVAFIRDDGTHRRVWVTSNMEGSSEVQLSPLEDCFDPCYSPDGTSLVVAARVGLTWDLFTIALDPATNFLTALAAPRALGTPALLPFTGGFPSINHPSWTL